MRTIGLIGGMSWESTAVYYRIINREIARRLGGLHSARLLMSSLDFEEIVARQKAGAWSELGAVLADAARRLERAGADCLLIGTNTMHRVAAEVEAAISIPLLHIADVAVAALQEAGCRRVALLGTRYTMEQPFYVAHLGRHGIACVVPDEAGRAEVHRVIFDELCKGDFNAASRRRLAGIVAARSRTAPTGCCSAAPSSRCR
jgi:aspartate racemase